MKNKAEKKLNLQHFWFTKILNFSLAFTMFRIWKDLTKVKYK